MGPIRQCNDLFDCSTVLSDHGKLRRRCGGVCPLRSVTAMDLVLPSAWNGSWDDAPNNPSAVRPAYPGSAGPKMACAAASTAVRSK